MLDGDELDIIRIADQHFVEQDRTRRVVVRVDEPRHDRHLLSVVGLRPSAGERFDLFARSYRHEAPGFDGKGFRPRHQWIDGVHFCVEEDEIGIGTLGREGRMGEPRRTRENRRTAGNEAHEFTTIVAALHGTSPGIFRFAKIAVATRLRQTRLLKRIPLRLTIPYHVPCSLISRCIASGARSRLSGQVTAPKCLN
jgi:hypothetical protein